MGPIEVVSSKCPGNSGLSSMVVDSEGTVHIAWEDNTNNNGSGGDYNIFYTKKPLGSNWTSVEVVSTESIYNSSGPSLAVDSFGDIHIAWWEYNEFGKQKQYALYKMKPTGGNWSSAEPIFPEVTWDYYAPSIACDAKGTVHVVWAANTDTGDLDGWDIYYRNKPRGDSWSSVEVVSIGSKRCSDAPVIAVEPDGIVHVAWNENTGPLGFVWNVFYKTRATNGTWADRKQISIEPLSYSSVNALVVGPDKTVHIAWSVPRSVGPFHTLNIFYRMKPYGGTWSNPERITTTIGAFGIAVDLAVGSDGTVHTVWTDIALWHMRWGYPLILYKNKPGGGTWTKHADTISIECNSSARFPQLAIGPEKDVVHIAWNDNTDYDEQGDNDSDIVYRTKPIANNQPPPNPTIVSPRIIKSEIIYKYKIMSIDPDGDKVYYFVYLQDVFRRFEKFLPLLGPSNSNEIINISIMWPFPYDIIVFQAMAVDVNGANSNWIKFIVITLPNKNDKNSGLTITHENFKNGQKGINNCVDSCRITII